MTKLLLLLYLMVLAASVHAAPAVSISDAQADFSAGNYRACLQKISSLLTSNLYPAASVERYDLLMLRGECMLMLKQSAAASAFDAASKVLKNKGDVPRVASAKALAVLVKASPKMLYKPKSGSEEPIDITNPEKRKQAMLALFQERSAVLQPQADKALQQTSLVPINKLLPATWEMYSLEFAANGNADKSTETVKALGAHARKLIGNELTRLTARLGQLNDLAGTVTLNDTPGPDTLGFRGLTSPERDELKSIADDIVKIESVCAQGRRIARLLGATGEAWDALEADCAEAREVAQQAYDRRY